MTAINLIGVISLTILVTLLVKDVVDHKGE